MAPDRGKQFRLFDRVDPQVGFQVKIQIQHFNRVTGLFAHSRQHIGFDGFFIAPSRRNRGWFRTGRGGCTILQRFFLREGYCMGFLNRNGRFRFLFSGRLGVPQIILDEADQLRQGVVIHQPQVFTPRNAVVRPHHSEQLGLLHGIHSQVGFQVQVEVQHFRRIPGLFADHFQNVSFDLAFVKDRDGGFRRILSGFFRRWNRHPAGGFARRRCRCGSRPVFFCRGGQSVGGIRP